MRITGATFKDLEAAGKLTGVHVIVLRGSGTYWDVGLRRIDDRWAKKDDVWHNPNTGATEPLEGAVCWHRHNVFIRAVLARCPEATVKTSIARFRGIEDFEKRHARTVNLSSRECECEAMIEKKKNEGGFLKRLIRIK